MCTHYPQIFLQRKKYTVTARNYNLSLGEHTQIMGIVNVTPDSFSQDGCFNRITGSSNAYALAQKHIRNGANIIDIGGESTRPGSLRVTVKKEIDRVIPTIDSIS